MKKTQQTVQSILRGALAIVLTAGSFLFSGTSAAQDLPAGDLTIISSQVMPPPGMRAPAGGGIATSVGAGAVFSNITTFSGNFFPNGGAATVSGDGITKLVANHYTLVGTPPFTINGITFSVGNGGGTNVSARYLVRFYNADGVGGGPGTVINGFSFNATTFNAGSINLINGTISTSIPNNDVWVGWTFDNNNGASGASLTDLNNLGMGLYNPVNLGTGYDNMFQTTAAGSFVVNNPAGTTTVSPFGASPVSIFSFEFRVPCVTPTVTCPANISVNSDAGVCGATVTYTTPTTGTAPFVQYFMTGATTALGSGNGSGTVFGIGTTTVNLTATSLSGCGAGNCSFTVTVTDVQAPVITCRGVAFINTDAGLCTSSSPTGSATATDNCSIGSISVNNPGPYGVGTTTVTWTATDASGNTSTCSQNIIVTDAELPVITCPATANLNTDAGICTASSPSGTATATDNCSVSSVVVDNAGPYAVGTTTVIWTATDVNGNTSSCSKDIIVTDIELPVITCPAAANLTVDAGACTSSAAAGDATATDNCSVASVVVDNAGPYSVGTTTVIWTATDVNGNTSSCSQDINVTDAEAPVITCPATSNLNTDAGICTASSSAGTATATDNCSVSSVTVDNAGPYSLGTTTVTWTATDASGNTSTCSQNIIVTDNQNPIISCPATANLNTDAGICTASSPSGTATATDNCSVASVVVDNAGPYAVGTTTVIWTATDVNGNTSSCSQDIIVTDIELPVITCPAAANLTVDAGACTSSEAAGNATATDNCSVASVVVDNAGPYSVGTTTVIWTATDVNGNTSTCSQDIIVTDNQAPTITAPADLTVCAGSPVVLGSPAVNDNCGTPSVSNDAPGIFSVGTTVVTWTTTDGSGNTATAIQNVTINATPSGTSAAISICDGSNVNFSLTSSIPGSTFTWTATNTLGSIIGYNSCVSGCGTTVSDVLSNLSGFGGIVDYSVTATSPAGCASAAFDITVTVTTVPTVPVLSGPFATCGLGTVTYTATSSFATSYIWTTPAGITITSGSGTSAITCSTTGFTNPGTMTCIANNVCGSSALVSQLLTKKPVPPSSISGPSSVCALTSATYSVIASPSATSYNWTLPTGMAITAGAGTTQITVSIVASSVMGNMRCDAVNACGFVTGPLLFITGHAPATPGTLSGPSSICGFTSGTYSIPAVAYATGYTWTVPSWMTITSGLGTTSITVIASGTPANGIVSVAATNVCGTGTARNLNVTIAATIPGAISGPTNICGVTTAAFTVPSLGAGYTYNWSLAMSSWTITSGAGTTAITCSGPATGTTSSGLVKVTSTNTCASTSGIRTKAVTYCHSAIANVAEQNGGTYSSLYPNPTNGEFKIDVTADANEEMTIQVYDVLGNLVISQKHQIMSGTSTLTTNLDNYKTGMYFVRLVDSSASTVYSQTVIKN